MVKEIFQKLTEELSQLELKILNVNIEESPDKLADLQNIRLIYMERINLIQNKLSLTKNLFDIVNLQIKYQPLYFK